MPFYNIVLPSSYNHDKFIRSRRLAEDDRFEPAIIVQTGFQQSLHHLQGNDNNMSICFINISTVFELFLTMGASQEDFL